MPRTFDPPLSDAVRAALHARGRITDHLPQGYGSRPEQLRRLGAALAAMARELAEAKREIRRLRRENAALMHLLQEHERERQP